MQKVMLLNPPFQLEDRYGKDMKHFGGVSEPLGLAYIAGYLEKEKIPVRIIDSQAERMSIDEIIENIKKHRDTIVGITMLTPMFGVVKEFCCKLKSKYPDCLIVLGGVHCTALPEKTLTEIPDADIICYGDGEFIMYEIATSNRENWKNITGICFRKENKNIKTPPREVEKNLDILPYPARHLLPMEKYSLTASRVSGSGYCPTIIVARGCPFSCTFCSYAGGKIFRTHSVERIIEEIHFIIDTYKAKQINIEADTLTVKKDFLENLCQALINTKINEKLKWTCESRISTVTEDLLILMKKAGCRQISYGIETGTQRLLDLIKKNVTLEKIEEVCALTKKLGITIRGFFMLGLPTETREESLATIKFAKKLDPKWAQFTVTIPYPGTPMFKELDKEGKIRTYDWDNYNTWWGWRGDAEAPYIPEGRTVKDLQLLQKQALRKFYMRPKIFWRSLLNIRSIYDIKKYARGGWVLIKSWFSK